MKSYPMKTKPLLGIALIGALTVAAPAVMAQGQARKSQTTLNAGTVIPVRLNNELSSNSSRKGDRFTATVLSDSMGYENFPEGSKMTGEVRFARAKRGGDPGTLDIDFQRLRLPNGKSYPIKGSIIGLDGKSVDYNDDGRMVAKPERRNNRLTYVGYGAGAGMIVSLLSNNGKLNFTDMLIGAGLGLLVGSVEKTKTEPRDVRLKPGTEMGLRLDRRLTFVGIPSQN